MKLVTSPVSTPVGQIQRIGTTHRDKLIDLNGQAYAGDGKARLAHQLALRSI